MSEVCRLCASSRVELVLRLERMPRNIQRLLRREEIDTDVPIRTDVFQCASCTFVQLMSQLEADYYDDYIMTTSHSEQMQEYQAEQARDFVNRYGLEGKSVMEAGCGDGNFLSHLEAAGASVMGLEPSRAFRRLATRRGYSVLDGYVTADSDLNGAPFDGFVSRQVLEHVPLIHDYLQGVKRNLKSGAYGLVEVPSLEKALSDRRYYDFFPDHLNYFSRRTLRLALEMSGFEVLETRSGMFDEYNIAIARSPGPQPMNELQTAANSLAREIEAFIRECKARGETVAIWGAGGKGLSVMAGANVSGVDFLIDSDTNKQGFFSPVSHLEVRSPDILRGQRVDAIILTAMAYKNEILRALRSEYGFKGTVVALGHHLEKVS